MQDEIICPYIIIRINKDMVPHWIKQDLDVDQYVSDTEDLYIQLDKHLYGLKQSV